MKKIKTFFFSAFFSLIYFFSLNCSALADGMHYANDPCYRSGNCPRSLGVTLYELRMARLQHIAIGVLVVAVVIVAIIILIKMRKKK